MKHKRILALLLCVSLLAWGPGAFADGGWDTWDARVASSGGTDGDRGIIGSGVLYRIRNTNGNYLRATGNNNFTQISSPTSGLGTELWYITEESSGVYLIESVGVRGGSSGTYGNMLTANSSSTTGTLSLTDKSVSDKQRWYVERNGINYTLRSCAYTTQYLNVESSNATPRTATTLTGSLWTLESVVKSNFWTAYYQQFYYPGTAYVAVVIEASALTAKHTWNDVYSPVASAWNNIDPCIQVSLFRSTDSIPSWMFTVYVRGANLGSTYGQMTPYPGTTTGGSEAGFNSQWGCAKIEINTGVLDSKGTADMQMNFLHELGHALKLRHPHETEDFRPVAVMNQGLPASNSDVPCRPSGYDKYSLKRKWCFE